ncbi:MAG TPA: hypothetical protein VIV60_24485 [Polyangiaceae bacterium]
MTYAVLSKSSRLSLTSPSRFSLPKGVRPGGSGDPYFVCVHEGEDPPLYHVHHDVSDRAAVILNEGRVLVAPHLSEFLASALLPIE